MKEIIQAIGVYVEAVPIKTLGAIGAVKWYHTPYVWHMNQVLSNRLPEQ